MKQRDGLPIFSFQNYYGAQVTTVLLNASNSVKYAVKTASIVEQHKRVEWHPKLSHFEENLHPILSHPNRRSCLIPKQHNPIKTSSNGTIENKGVPKRLCSFKSIY